ncbi:MAG: tyrosine--tRNA ligase [Planctomycetes bacterium]|nr:tyrosine--tRNA ligase [Planctomycetota bacterium]
MRRIQRGSAEVFPEDELRKKLERSRATGRPLRVKLGVDPTAPDIHLGNAVPIWKLRAFQEMGHVAVLIIGDYTARIGDPSGRNALRPPLDEAAVDANAQTYFDQARTILLPDRLEIRRNGEWLSKLSFMDVVRLTSRMTVAQMLVRDDFAKRFGEEVPISLHEFLYPLMQGWDSVVVRSDLELGGTDQRFNLLVGRDLQRIEGQEPQAILVNPLVPGTDGVKKMSKSTGNYIGITESPEQQFGKSMSIPDALMAQWFASFTEVPEDRVAALLGGHPRDAKEALAKAIVARYHGEAAADGAAAEFRRVFTKKEIPDDLPEICVSGPIAAPDLVVLAGFAESRGEAKRLVQQGAVSLGDVKVTDAKAMLTPADGTVLRVGKLKFARLRA